MSALHASIDEFCPDIKKILFLGPKHINPLSTGDLAVQIVFLSNLANGYELVCINLTPGNSGDDGKCAVSLNVCQKPVVCVLQIMEILVHNVLIELTCEYRRDSRLTQLASEGIWVLADCLHDIGKVFQLLHRNYIIEVDTRVREVTAY